MDLIQETTESTYWQDQVAKPAGADQILEASTRLQTAIRRLDGLGLVIVIRMGDTVVSIDASGDEAVIVDVVSSTPAASIEISPSHLIDLIDDQLEPRSALFFGHIRVVGDRVAAIRFADRIAGHIGAAEAQCPASDQPEPTSDVEHAKRDLHEFGYAVVLNAISPQTVAELRLRLIEQADAERAAGNAMLDGGPGLPNQRVWSLVNKGAPFRELMLHPLISEICVPFLGEHFLLAGYSANIARAGGRPQTLHYDQQALQPPIPFRTCLTLIWFLDDVAEENGGTRVHPGSHRWSRGPSNPQSIEGTVAATGPAGSLLLVDGLVWHGTGENRTHEGRHVLIMAFYRYYIRTLQNWGLSLTDEAETWTRKHDGVASMLGFRITGFMGATDEVREGRLVDRRSVATSELR